MDWRGALLGASPLATRAHLRVAGVLAVALVAVAVATDAVELAPSPSVRLLAIAVAVLLALALAAANAYYNRGLLVGYAVVLGPSLATLLAANVRPLRGAPARIAIELVGGAVFALCCATVGHLVGAGLRHLQRRSRTADVVDADGRTPPSTELRLTRRRALAGVGAAALGTGGLAAIPPYRVSAAVWTPAYVVRVGVRGPPDATAVSSLAPPAREAVRAAIRDRYETDAVPAELLAFLDPPENDDREYERELVTDGDTYYRLRASLPVQAIRADPAEPPDDESKLLTVREFRSCIAGEPGYLRTGPVIVLHGGEYRRYRLDDPLRNCIEDHPYVEREDGEVFRWRVERVTPPEPYTLEADPVDVGALLGIGDGEDGGGGDGDDPRVGEWADLPSSVREFLVAHADTHAEERESVPESVRAVADRYDWIRRGDRFYDLTVTDTGAVGIEVDVTVTDPVSREFDPAWLRFTVRNTGDRPVALSTGPPPPFGTLWARRRDGRNGADDDGGDDGGPANALLDGPSGFLLWTPEYVESEHVFTRLGLVYASHAVGLSVRLEPGEAMQQRFAVRRDPGWLSPGRYVVDSGFDIDPVAEDGGRGEHASYPFEVRLRVE